MNSKVFISFTVLDEKRELVQSLLSDAGASYHSWRANNRTAQSFDATFGCSKDLLNFGYKLCQHKVQLVGEINRWPSPSPDWALKTKRRNIEQNLPI